MSLARGESGDGPRSEERPLPHRSRRGPQPRRVYGLRGGVPQRQRHGSRGQGRVLPKINGRSSRKPIEAGSAPCGGSKPEWGKRQAEVGGRVTKTEVGYVIVSTVISGH